MFTGANAGGSPLLTPALEHLIYPTPLKHCKAVGFFAEAALLTQHITFLCMNQLLCSLQIHQLRPDTRRKETRNLRSNTHFDTALKQLQLRCVQLSSSPRLLRSGEGAKGSEISAQHKSHLWVAIPKGNPWGVCSGTGTPVQALLGTLIAKLPFEVAKTITKHGAVTKGPCSAAAHCHPAHGTDRSRTELCC